MTITVDRFDDVAGASACTVAANDCSLRGAVIFANANPGTTINVPAGTYQLTIDGGSESGFCGDSAKGDLDIAGNNTIMVGAGSATTIIQQTKPNDRVICVNQFLVNNFNFTMSGFTLTGGRETFGIGGGAMASGGLTSTTTLSDMIFSNNQASGGGTPTGGGISHVAGNLSCNNCVFGGANPPGANQLDTTLANRTSGAGGGLIIYASISGCTTPCAGSYNITNSAFRNNATIAGSGGGAHVDTGISYTFSNVVFSGNIAQGVGVTGGALASASGVLNVDHSTFVNNQAPGASSRGGAIGSFDGATNAANMSIQFSRFNSNTAAVGSAVYTGGGSTTTATNNWWGCNTGPNTAGCGTIANGAANPPFPAGVTNFTPFIVLSNTASPSTINVGQATTLTASVLRNSNNQTLTAANVSALVGVPVTWGSAVHGSFSNQQTSIQASGQATATLTQDGTCNNSAGSATVDNATVAANVTVQCADLTLTKLNNVSGQANQGGNWNWTLRAANVGSGTATFAPGQTILTDDLPTTGLSYSTPSVGNVTNVTNSGNINCSIASNTLTCVANGATVTLGGVTGVFDVTIPVTSVAGGVFTNPRGGGACSIDPNSVIAEGNEANNTCTANVVNASTSTATRTPTSTPTNTPTSTNTSTPTSTSTQTATNTPTVTSTPTQTNTSTQTSTSTVTSTPTDTPTPAATNTPTSSTTPTQTATPTTTPINTSTATATTTATSTTTATATATATATSTPAPTITPGPPLGALVLVTPVRVVDTRPAPLTVGFDQNGAPISPALLTDQQTARFKLAGQPFGAQSIPADVTAVLVNVSLVRDPSVGSGGFVTLFPADLPTAPNAATVLPVNPIAHNFAVVNLPTSGSLQGVIGAFNVGGPTFLIIDLVGYYSPSAANSLGGLTLLTPVRVVDTRPNPIGPIGFQANGQPLTAGTLPADQITRFHLAGETFSTPNGPVTLPSTLTGVIVHLTLIQPSGSGGFATLLPGDVSGVPTTASVNPAQPISFNSAIIGIPTTGGAGIAGTLGLYLAAISPHVTIDLIGVYHPGGALSGPEAGNLSAASPQVVGGLNFVPPSRVVDTRPAPIGPIGYDGAGVPLVAGLLPDGAEPRYRLGGQSFVNGQLVLPNDLRGVLINVTIVQTVASGGYLTIYPGDVAVAPLAASVNPSTPIAGSFWVSGVPLPPGLNPQTIAAKSVGDPKHLIVDLMAYYR